MADDNVSYTEKEYEYAVSKGIPVLAFLHGEPEAIPVGRTDRDESKVKKAEDKTCLQQVGKARSDQMVKQCLQVSMATHPPCNGENSCKLITDEIRRSCQLLGNDGPGFCDEYR